MMSCPSEIILLNLSKCSVVIAEQSLNTVTLLTLMWAFLNLIYLHSLMKKNSLKLVLHRKSPCIWGEVGSRQESFIKRLTSSEFPMEVFFSCDTADVLISDFAVFIVL